MKTLKEHLKILENTPTKIIIYTITEYCFGIIGVTLFLIGIKSAQLTSIGFESPTMWKGLLLIMGAWLYSLQKQIIQLQNKKCEGKCQKKK